MPNAVPKTLILIDGHALAYRTYFALTGTGRDSSQWTTKSGEPTAGTYGFTAVLFRILEQDQPDYMAVSFDTGRTFRDDLFPAYKGTRDKMPDDLSVQLGRIHQVVRTFNLPVLAADGYEADDVLGSVARRAEALGIRTVIVTGDRDLLQLATPNTIIRLSGQKLSESVDYDPQTVQETVGVTPGQYVDYKALVGDKSDNIPGVPGIGEKTAVKLLADFGSLDAIYARLPEVPTRFQKKLAEFREQAFLSQRLSRIVTDLDVEFDVDACRVGTYDRAQVVALFRELEFRSLLNRIPADGSDTRSPGLQLALFSGATAIEVGASPTRVQVVDTPDGLAALAQSLSRAPRIALDVETDSTDSVQTNLVGLALSTTPGEATYVPLGHRVPEAGTAEECAQLALPQVVAALRGPLSDPAIPKVGHNLKFDLEVLARHGLRPAPLTFDTLLAEWLCDPASRNLGLKSLAWIRLGVEMVEISELIGRGAKQITMDCVPIARVAQYAGADVDMTLRLVDVLEPELRERGLWRLFTELEMPLISVLADMEMTGIALDVDYLRLMSSRLQAQLDDLSQQITALVGHAFNLNSPQQLSHVLFDHLGLVPPDRSRKTSAGRFSTAADVLESLRGKHAVVDLILEHRELSKLKSTYVDALPEQVNPATGRVHTSYNQAGSVTGRLASSNPNLQNIPIRSELGRQVRRAFVAAPEHTLVAVDYSQVELRILAHVSQDVNMRAAFHDGRDVHAATAAAVFGVPLESVTSDQRRHAKSVNFGLIYGMSAFGLTRSSDLTLAEAETFVKAYFEQFPGVQRYLEETRRLATEQGYVETLLGRRRYFPILSRPGTTREDAITRARAEREAVNAPIQGTAADIMKIAMLRLPAELARRGLSGRMLLQVHDELVLEAPAEEAGATVAAAREVMKSAFNLDVPLGTEAKVGANWEEMKLVLYS